jgi:hypothetical protein
MVIEARLVDDVQQTAPVRLAVVDRELTTSTLGLSLAEGKALLASVQQYLVRAQCAAIAAAHSSCETCDAKLSVKGCHERQLRTVFGRVKVRSPRVRCCACAGRRPGASFSPLIQLVPTGVTPPLESLQVRWAAHLPFATAARLLGELLPIADAISVSGVKRRVRAVGAALEASAPLPKRPEPAKALSALAVDSVWLRHCDPPRGQARHVNVVAGRACFEGGPSRVYASTTR